MYCPYCGQPIGDCDCERIAAEEHEEWLRDYENRPEVLEGWHQDDIIYMYRRER